MQLQLKNTRVEELLYRYSIRRAGWCFIDFTGIVAAMQIFCPVHELQSQSGVANPRSP